jgi:hypothetical protein
MEFEGKNAADAVEVKSTPDAVTSKPEAKSLSKILSRILFTAQSLASI